MNHTRTLVKPYHAGNLSNDWTLRCSCGWHVATPGRYRTKEAADHAWIEHLYDTAPKRGK